MSTSVMRNGRESLACFLTEVNSRYDAINTNRGTGENQKILGRVNQRAAMLGWVNGVHKLTTAMIPTMAATNGAVSARIRACNSPLVCMINQVLPSKA